jgi:hypothetical protein
MPASRNGETGINGRHGREIIDYAAQRRFVAAALADPRRRQREEAVFIALIAFRKFGAGERFEPSTSTLARLRSDLLASKSVVVLQGILLLFRQPERAVEFGLAPVSLQ